MMRKFVSLLVVGMLFVVGCSTSPKPESTVSNFIEAGKKFDLVQMATMINPSSSGSKEKITDLTKEDSENKFQKYFLDYLKENAAKITYTVKGSKIENDKATVSVNFKYVNGGLLLKATIGEVFSKAISLAFSGVELSDEETGQMFVDAMKKQKGVTTESFKEKMVDIKLVKVDKKWYIDEPNEELLDVLMSDFISVGKEISTSMSGSSTNSSNQDSMTMLEKAKKDNMTINHKVVGDEITLATVNLKVNRVDEKQTLTAKYSSPVTAKEGAKFIIVNLDLINMTNKAFTFPSGLIVVDNKNREFKSYSDSIGSVENYIDYRELSPSIKENGNLVFELPSDATSYSLLVAKAGTNELYQILLK